MTELDQLSLLPRPRRVRSEPGGCDVRKTAAVSKRTGASGLPAEGYRLTIAASGIVLEAADDAGSFYGRMTLRQLARVCPDGIPCGVIEDWPDIPVRGVMLDISRDKVPTMETLFMLVDMFAEWKINHLQLYMEHTFAYRDHPAVWAEASPMTPAEVQALDAYCRERFIELAPNQNSFGHFERWLKHPRYRPLAESPDGFRAADGQWRENPTTLCPADPRSLDLISELYAELLPNFTSRRLHVGGDETWELGKGRSRPEVERLGLARVYLDYLGKLKKLAAAHDRAALYWGDMVWNHFPGQLDRLDREMIHVDWGYYRDYPYRDHGEKLTAADVPFWVAPGTGTWSTLVGCNEAAFGSNRGAAQCAVEFGAQGYLNTDWGDGGHWQHLPVSFIGFAAGAAMSWCESANGDDDIRAALDPHVFRDEAGVAGRAAFALAETWTRAVPQATQPFHLDRILRRGLRQELPEGMTVETLQATSAHLEAALAALSEARMQRPDGQLIVDELTNNANLALHACRLGTAVARDQADRPAVRRELAVELSGMMAARRRLWFARNREGGLGDSLRVLEQRLEQYRKA